MYGIVVTPARGEQDVRETFLDRCFKDSDGRVVIGQTPNAPIIVWLVSRFLVWPLSGGAEQVFRYLAFGALFTWGWLELSSGVNYFRRALGLLAMIALILAGP